MKKIKLFEDFEIKEKIENRFGLDKKEKIELGKWFKKKMVEDTLFPSPGYIFKFFPDAFGNIDLIKYYANKQAKETIERYYKSNTKIPNDNIYPIKGRKFWYN